MRMVPSASKMARIANIDPSLIRHKSGRRRIGDGARLVSIKDNWRTASELARLPREFVHRLTDPLARFLRIGSLGGARPRGAGVGRTEVMCEAAALDIWRAMYGDAPM